MLCPTMIRTVLPDDDSVRSIFGDDRVGAVVSEGSRRGEATTVVWGVALAIPVVAAAVGWVAAAEGLVIGVAANRPLGVSAGVRLGAALACRTDAEGGELPQATPANSRNSVTTTTLRELTSLGRGAVQRGSSHRHPVSFRRRHEAGSPRPGSCGEGDSARTVPETAGSD